MSRHLITSHIVEGLPTELRIEVIDEPGPAGANHGYIISGFDNSDNPSSNTDIEPTSYTALLFQNGVVPDVGHNGITLEALLAVAAHRLQGFQDGVYACDENQVALDHINGALEALKGRTRARLVRDVEGKRIV